MARTYDLHVLLSREELDMIHRKMANMGIKNRSAFLRKMALDGYIVNLDMDDIHEMIRLLRNTTNNLNQIAKKANSGGTIYGAEISAMLEKQDEVWETSKEILARLAVIQ